jgi:hypothetical protein
MRSSGSAAAKAPAPTSTPKSESAIRAAPPNSSHSGVIQRLNEPAEEETQGTRFDVDKLFVGVEPPRKVGGTALVNIMPGPNNYSALPRDVSVYIREDSIENLPPPAKSGSRLWMLCLVGIIVSTIGLAIAYALAKPL